METSADTTNQKRILILSAGFGDGHNAAAFGLRAAFSNLGHHPIVADVFHIAHPGLNDFLRKAYQFAIIHTPKIWRAIYSSSDAADFTQRRFDIFAPSTRALKKIIEDFEPDAVVSTYPLYAHLIERLVGSHGHLPVPFVSIVTDAQTINSIWFSSQSDHYCVIDEVSAQVLRDAGVPSKKISVLGFPINPDFDQPDCFVPDSPLKILFLPSTIKKQVTAILKDLVQNDSLPTRKITIVLGRHAARLKSTVEQATKRRNPNVTIDVLGWTNQIPALLRSHHCVIGKAGGASVQEAMAARCPLLINYIVPGQEEGNAHQAISSGSAKLIEHPSNIAPEIASLLDNHRTGLKSMRTAAQKTGNPAASNQIANFVLSRIQTSIDPS